MAYRGYTLRCLREDSVKNIIKNYFPSSLSKKSAIKKEKYVQACFDLKAWPELHAYLKKFNIQFLILKPFYHYNEETKECFFYCKIFNDEEYESIDESDPPVLHDRGVIVLKYNDYILLQDEIIKDNDMNQVLFTNNCFVGIKMFIV